MRRVLTPLGWEDYLYWQKTDRATLNRLNRLLNDVLRDPMAGIGKPEPLRHVLAGCWSRRVDEEHRLVDAERHSVRPLCGRPRLAERDGGGSVTPPRRKAPPVRSGGREQAAGCTGLSANVHLRRLAAISLGRRWLLVGEGSTYSSPPPTSRTKYGL
jgi:toxin YoeB